MKNIILILFFLILNLSSSFSQNIFKKYVNSLIKDTVSEERVKFTVFPTLSYSPETNVEVGFNALYVYKANQRKENRLSEVSAFTFYTLNNQYGFFLSHALYSDYNIFFYLGELKYKSFPLKYFGVGPTSQKKAIAVIDGSNFLFKERILGKLKESFYTGLEVGFETLQKVEIIDDNIDSFEDASSLVGLYGSRNLSLGWGLVFDNRHNILNARKGFYSELAFLHSNKSILSDYTFTNFFIDNRYYKSLNEKNVLAFQMYSKFGYGEIPINQLALLGGEYLMRGYYFGRYRDNAYLAGQIEYRMLPFSFAKRFGGSLFLASGGVGPRLDKIALNNFKIAGGGGLQFLLFPKKDVYTRFDIAFTEEGTGFYIRVGEAF